MALTAERKETKKMLGEPLPPRFSFPVKGTTKLYKGSLVCLDAGYARPGTLASSLVAEGRAVKTVDNTSGSDGDLAIEVEQGAFFWENHGDITQADVGFDAYMTDDQTVQADATGASRAGTIVQVDDDGVWVYTALSPTANSVVSLSKRTVQITQADLTDAVNGEAQSINIGAALPTNAVVLAHEVNIATLFSGGSASAVKLDIGGTTATAIVSQMDVFTGAATGALSPRTGAHAQGKFSAQQLKAQFTPDAGHTLLGLTAGDLTITIWYVVLA